MRRRSLGILLCLALALPTLPHLVARLGLCYPLTSSLPGWLYHHSPIDAPLERGQLVLLCVPQDFDPLALERSYYTTLGFGVCRPDEWFIGKRLLALPGDLVSIEEHGLSVNGRLLDGTVPAHQDGYGRALEPFPYRQPAPLPSGSYLVGTSSHESYDSRYYGPIPRRFIRRTLRRLL